MADVGAWTHMHCSMTNSIISLVDFSVNVHWIPLSRQYVIKCFTTLCVIITHTVQYCVQLHYICSFWYAHIFVNVNELVIKDSEWYAKRWNHM